MELFHENGHLTDEGLQAITAGTLNELQSLEASEHLGYCTVCLERYLALLETAPLLQPATPIRDNVLKRIGRKAKRIIFSRYATVAAAACLVLAMWGSGFLTSILGNNPQDNVNKLAEGQPAVTEPAAYEDPGPSLATRMNRAAIELPDTLNDLFGFLSPHQDNPPAETQQAAQAEDASNSASEAQGQTK